MTKWPVATFINVATVMVGSLIGLVFYNILSDSIQQIIFQAIGLGTIVIGAKMMMKIPDNCLLLMILSLICGGIAGEISGLDDILFGLSERLKNSLSLDQEDFSKGLITAFILFCVGSMTIVGAIEEGINGNRELLLTKSTLDGFSSIGLAASFGIGVMFSVIPMLVFQGGLTMLAGSLKKHLSQTLIDLISSIGGVLIIGISVDILGLGEINLINLLPSLLLVGPFYWIKKKWL